MKIMQVNVVYPTGSTGGIVKDIHSQLIKHGHNSIICYGRGRKISEKNVYKIAPEFIMKAQSLRAKITGYAYSGCFFSTTSLIRIIKREKPEIVHLHCLNGYMVNIYKLLKYLKTSKIPTVLTLHAEFMFTAGCGHALDCNKWKIGCGNCPQKGKGRPASKIFDRSANEWKLMNSTYRGYDRLVIVSVSEWLYNRAKESPFFINNRLRVVLNGIDTKNIFKPTKFEYLKKEYSIQNKKIILHVTADFNNPIKGGEYVVKIASELITEDILIIIVGFNGDKRILPPNVLAVPKINVPTTLAAFYSMADLTLLTSLKETFSMICAESLSCGTPVVGFKAGAPETIAIKEFSEFVPQGNISLLKNSILNHLETKTENGDIISRKASNIYSKEKMYKEYFRIYNLLSGGI